VARPLSQPPVASRLVYHAGALGDFITSLPAMRAWRGAASTILLGLPAHAALADPPFTVTWDAGAAAFAPLFSPGVTASAYPARLCAGVRAALVYATSSSPLADNLRALGVRDVLRQDPFPGTRTPVVDYHLSVVGAGDPVPRVAVPADAPFPVEPGTAAIAPGSGSAAKNWPFDRFVEISFRLKRRGMSVCWIMGPAEESLAPPAGAWSWRNLPLHVLAAALSRCRLYVGNDSGITHLSAASGCPTVALFGGSDALVWAPRGATVRVVTSPGCGMMPLDVESVWAACLDVVE
jgi:heptosyltransferase-3